MSDARVVEFGQLVGSDLVLDRIYRGGAVGGTGDDPLSKLLRVGNQGGFRPAGSPKKDSVKLAVLYTTGSEPDWPDALDPYTGTFTYYGDNPAPGPGAGEHQGESAAAEGVRVGARGCGGTS